VDDAHDGSYAREPQLDDLVRLARALNAHHVRYVLIGGFAVIAHGGARTTKDIDLLIDAGPENVARVREALQILEDKAVDDVADDDVARYSVVRVGRRDRRGPDGAGVTTRDFKEPAAVVCVVSGFSRTIDRAGVDLHAGRESRLRGHARHGHRHLLRERADDRRRGAPAVWRHQSDGQRAS
jgi:hypothetical protein